MKKKDRPLQIRITCMSCSVLDAYTQTVPSDQLSVTLSNEDVERMINESSGRGLIAPPPSPLPGL